MTEYRYIGPLVWLYDGRAPFGLPLACLGHSCRLWVRWNTNDGPHLYQHSAHPDDPTEAVLELPPCPLPRLDWWQQLVDWTYRVHAYEDALA
jgi:hypothetical protein